MKYYVYDFESIVDPNNCVHTVNYVVVEQLYEDELMKTFIISYGFGSW